jgi:hypothetical protein
MQSPVTTKKFHLHKLGMYCFNAGLLAGILMLSFGLTSCGGGGGTPAATADTTPTISYISPSGIVASSVPQTITIVGTNFVTGMSYSITSSSGVPYTISSSSLLSPTQLSVKVAINPAPADNYVMFAIKASGSSTTLASNVLGVASSVQVAANAETVFTNNICTGCHNSGTLSGGLDLTDLTLANSTGVLQTSSGCSPKLRITPGDPRRSSSVLIDKIEATSTSHACNGVPMPYGGSQISPTDIQTIVDWVAGGAKK